ncbi:MAG: ATP-binding protein [Oscillospiraceae bacterium]|nr:ATP-binding protein [Oscillospiraceae bacterium]
MKDLSLNILDIAQNSLKAGAALIRIALRERDGVLRIVIEDDGRGMEPELAARVTDPFVTTRDTRKVGLGLPFYRQAAEQTGGSLELVSAPGRGTTVTAVFHTAHIDAPPAGDMPATIQTLIQGSPDVDFDYSRERDGKVSSLDTRLMREQLGDIPLNEPDVLQWIYESLTESEKELE